VAEAGQQGRRVALGHRVHWFIGGGAVRAGGSGGRGLGGRHCVGRRGVQ